MVVVVRWGTWEELILGGAVLRHGTRAWDAVASELRARTLYPYSFTPETCKAKYEDLQQRYSGCTAWFEELRKRRVAELRQELEKSEDSIGSLELKLESLKAEKRGWDYGSSRTTSPVPVLKSEGVEIFGKETPKDGLSAGSFTLPGCEIPTSIAEMDTQPEISESSEQVKFSSIKNLAETSSEQGVTLQKRRGKRKRKYYNKEPKEWTNGVSENLGSTDVLAASKENSTSGCCPTARSSSINNHDRGSRGFANDDLMGIFNSIAENNAALVFRRRLDSQKRARYRNTIRRHMDLDTIRARIASCSIMSMKELFRDMLLLANNAMVFYSKRTREHKTALLLRDIVTKAYRQYCPDFNIRAASPIFPLYTMCNPPVKPRSVRFGKRKLSNLPNAELVVAETPQGWRRPSNVENIVARSPETCGTPSNAGNISSGTSQVFRKPSSTGSGPSMESTVGKKSFSRVKKVGCGTSKRPKALIEERKRARR
ncbi:Ankyrin repeat, bromo and BTB domain-containing protein [Actinidia chinensis var. chinensis]|uniref:Ankyrin repeat, bromo and BTB domain-containing protein n=1 Tax=Actinidia chinensis var. chinensis TaxID=1590841 RepID=A0A2R6QLI6_ACTCC|nr:Ankyrin repeat, bromo and BTB domain-containing protein [Actinidia chinensis var. chinensis]